jgi:hypothetical protein
MITSSGGKVTKSEEREKEKREEQKAPLIVDT